MEDDRDEAPTNAEMVDKPSDETAVSQEPGSGEPKEVNWEVVAKESGLATAQILAHRLQAEGIPSYAWQEGAGQAFGLTIGKLGTGYVMVPEEYKEAALSILATPADDYESYVEAVDEEE